MNVADLAQSIIEKRTADLTTRISQYQRKNSILSDVADCERYMTYAVLDWDKRPVHDAELQARFDVGNLWEREMVRDLQGLGFTVTLSQQPVQIIGRGGELIATGKIDGFIQWEGRRYPVEFKSMNSNVFNSINTVEDFGKKPWTRKYLKQIQMYMFGNNCEEGLFIVNDCLGHWKLFPVYLDLGECEAILQKLERVAGAIKSKTYPDRIAYDQSICGKCPFAVQCLQDVINRPADLIDNEVLEADITRHEELKPLAKEFETLHDNLKGTFNGIEKAIVGTRWMIQNVPSKRTVYELTKEAEEQIGEIKKAHSKQVPVTRLVIQDLTATTQKADAA